jgi:hypothetical protein
VQGSGIFRNLTEQEFTAEKAKIFGIGQRASGNRKTCTYGTYLPRFEQKKIFQIAASRFF